jgi:phosphoribosylformylglycinamidine synthase
MDLKAPGNLIYLVGRTNAELGGSHFAKVNGLEGGDVPQVDLQLAPRIFAGLHQAIASGLVRSCHDLSEGGLAVAAAEMAFAGGFGLELDLNQLRDESRIEESATMLFSESNSRFLVEVAPERRDKLESLLADLPLVRLGTVTQRSRFVVTSSAGQTVIDSSLHDLKHAWQSPLAWD